MAATKTTRSAIGHATACCTPAVVSVPLLVSSVSREMLSVVLGPNTMLLDLLVKQVQHGLVSIATPARTYDSEGSKGSLLKTMNILYVSQRDVQDVQC